MTKPHHGTHQTDIRTMQERKTLSACHLCDRRISNSGGDCRYSAGNGSRWCWFVVRYQKHNSAAKHNIDLIELGLPFTDPIADGPTIQKSNTQALKNGTTVESTLDTVRKARRRGLRAPVLFMGYYNPLLSYGEERILQDAKEAGVNGFIVVDLPPEEAVRFRNFCTKGG